MGPPIYLETFDLEPTQTSTSTVSLFQLDRRWNLSFRKTKAISNGKTAIILSQPQTAFSCAFPRREV